MNRIPLMITAFAVVAAFGQRIETQKADRTKITCSRLVRTISACSNSTSR